MKIISALCLALLALPCSAADKAKKKEQLLSQQAVSAHSFEEAIANTKPVPLAAGKKIKRAITLENPVLELDGHKVLYDLYSMPGRAGQGFTLEVWSTCKCFGFDKTIIVPKFAVLSDGKPLPVQVQSVGKDAAGITPLHYETTLTGTFDRDGDVQVLIYGDTGDVGSAVTTVDGGSVYVAGALTTVNIGSFAITKSPVGNISIELLKR